MSGDMQPSAHIGIVSKLLKLLNLDFQVRKDCKFAKGFDCTMRTMSVEHNVLSTFVYYQLSKS